MTLYVVFTPDWKVRYKAKRKAEVKLRSGATVSWKTFVAGLEAKGQHVVREPSLKALEEWTVGSTCKCPDGCRVEPDGTCEHGCPSWLMILGIC
jgi:hypothetical protein